MKNSQQFQEAKKYNMVDSLNQVTYGNLNKFSIDQLKEKCIADAVIPILDKVYGSKLDFPVNDSDTTKEELNIIKKALDTIYEEDNAEHLGRFRRYDKSLMQTINSVFYVKGVTVDDLVKSVSEDITPAIYKLKQKYQRPRPYQLAQYYKLKLFPYNSLSAHTPSYPSGHTVQAYVILNVIGSKHPKTYQYCKKMIDDIAQSRVSLGVHYPSDNDASYIIGREILKLPEFTKKYEL